MIRSGRNAVQGSRSLCTRQRSVADPGRGYFARPLAVSCSAVATNYVCRDSAVSNPILMTAGSSSSWLFHNSEGLI